MFTDYSTILMQIEQKTKSLSNKCLNKKYEGFAADIAAIHCDLTLLAMWISQQQRKEAKEQEKYLKAA